jgi:hypothetical protein
MSILRTNRTPLASPTGEPAASSTAERLAQLANLLVVHGPEADVVKDFIRAHEHDREFAELAPLSVALKRALALRPGDPDPETQTGSAGTATHPG